MNGDAMTNQLTPKQRSRRKSYLTNKDKQIQTSITWARSNPERVAEINKRYRKNNPDKVRQRQNRWQHNNPEKVSAKNKRAYHKRKEKLWQQFISELVEEVNNG